MEGVRELVEIVGRVVRVVVKVVKVVIVVVEGVGEVLVVGGRIGGGVWELVGEGRGLLGVVGRWIGRVGGWRRRRVEDWMDE